MQALPSCPHLHLCLKGWDRARALERAFELAWAESAPANRANPFETSVYGLWSPTSASPALLLNTTEVETGARVVIAPFRRGDGPKEGRQDGGDDPLNMLLDHAPRLNPRLSTAVGLSARFPFLTPAAWYMDESGENESRKRRLVDGGYYDNSGLATGRDVVEVLLSEAQREGLAIDIKLIVLAGTPKELPTSYAFSELLSAPETMLRTREEHERRIEQIARQALEGQRHGVALSMHYARLDVQERARCDREQCRDAGLPRAKRGRCVQATPGRHRDQFLRHARDLRRPRRAKGQRQRRQTLQ
jgi:hypothetical protein